jgi:cytidine deaminase
MTPALRLRLVRAARAASTRAYAPFSGFRVGAAVFTGKGRVYAGCNVENSSYGLTICAERVAIVKAVSAGARAIKALALYAAPHRPSLHTPHSPARPPGGPLVTRHSSLVPPCGACLQLINEFGDNPEVILSNGPKTEVCRLHDLLPRGFRLPR